MLLETVREFLGVSVISGVENIPSLCWIPRHMVNRALQGLSRRSLAGVPTSYTHGEQHYLLFCGEKTRVGDTQGLSCEIGFPNSVYGADSHASRH